MSQFLKIKNKPPSKVGGHLKQSSKWFRLGKLLTVRNQIYSVCVLFMTADYLLHYRYGLEVEEGGGGSELTSLGFFWKSHAGLESEPSCILVCTYPSNWACTLGPYTIFLCNKGTPSHIFSFLEKGTHVV